MTFNDEFEGTSLDPSKWSFGFGWGTNSGSFSEINRPENVYLEDGKLVIRIDTMPNNAGWWSGAVNTKSQFSQKRGYFEARIKMARGKGLANAFWSKPVTEDWPPEIDFIEVLGKNDARDAYFTVHYLPGHLQSGGQWTSPVSLADDYHVYGFEWSEKDFTWYVDGEIKRKSADGYESITGYGHPFYMMLNVHVKCKDAGCQAWAGVPDETNEWPAFMHIDWVRVYTMDNSISTEITNIVSGQVFDSGETILVETIADKINGEITRVELYADENKTGESTVAPYTFLWSPASRNRYTLQTIAYDLSNAFSHSPPVYVTVADDIESNLVINPEFDEGTEVWNLWVKEPFAASFEVDDACQLSGINSAKINVENGGTSLSNIRFYQKIYLEQGKSYHLSLQAKSSVDRKVLISVRSRDVSYSHHMHILNLTPETKTFSTSFQCTRSDFLGLLEFSLGSTKAEIFLDSLVLKEETVSIVDKFRSDTEQFNLYYNPASGHLLIDFPEFMSEPAIWRIADIHGKIIETGLISSGENVIRLKSHRPGMYFVILSTNEKVFTGRFAKK